MTTMTANPADIARALSEEQRRLFMDASSIYGRGRMETPRAYRSGVRVSSLTFRKLYRMGLIEQWPPFLTDVGLAVRDHLLHRPTANDASTDRNQATVDGCGKEIEK